MPDDARCSYEIITPADGSEWNHLIQSLPGAHILQSYQWAEIKRLNGWEPVFVVWKDPQGEIVAAAVLHKKMFPILKAITPVCLLYSPRGPLLDWSNALLRTRVMADLQEIARKSHAIFLKIDPEVAIGTSTDPGVAVSEDGVGLAVQSELASVGWRFSQDQLQFRNTVLLPLDLSEEDLLRKMKQKTRYNIHLAEKKGVRVRHGSLADLDLLYQMYAQTSLRDGFAIRSREYYFEVWSRLIRDGIAIPLIAEAENEAVSGIILFIFGQRGYYFYGMSTEKQREKMPNHLLQWEAIRISKEAGCTEYDFWGAPDEFTEQDRMQGVYRFKEGFSGTVVFSLGAWDYPVNRSLYRFYTRTLPKIMNVMRWFGRKRVAQEVQQG
jgi:peptidoglycan pentaglycine glycine transferase (the first glycine)